MPILQLHQLRVAAVASMICDAISVQIDKDSVVKACLLHDMGNIVKFDLGKLPEHNEPEGKEYWEKIQMEFISKYGSSDHKANVDIAKELGFSDRIAYLISSVDSEKIEEVKSGSDFACKICAYSDNRVSPHKVVSIHERIKEAKERYKDHPKSFSEEERIWYIDNMEEIEKQIFSRANIKPEDITDEVISDCLEEFRSFSI